MGDLECTGGKTTLILQKSSTNDIIFVSRILES